MDYFNNESNPLLSKYTTERIFCGQRSRIHKSQRTFKPGRSCIYIWKAKCNFSTLISSRLLIVFMTGFVLSLEWIFSQRACVVLVLEEKGFFFRVKIDLSRRHGQMKEEWLTSHGKYSKSALPALYFTTMQRLWTILCALTQTWNFLIFPPGQTAHDLLRCVFYIGPTPAPKTN